MAIKEKLRRIKKLVCDVKRTEKGYEFNVDGKLCKMSLKPRCEVCKKELLLSCDVDLVIDGVLWLGVTYGNGPTFDYEQDMIELYAHIKDMSKIEQLEKRAEVNNFVSGLEV